ncbi:ribosomal protein S7e [Terfezia boudieri ATCC MYA-4762]|uniref:40S ribosomal protein S7 n=1 Tax=Terfezia boudieri ATCC MYA-4762 TaxID=1051890 RepID=A0A3N4LTC2_9PEZI|nr:ribosomal protein S7e [Terfezia boudieri ATCC MYA-4762]
MSAIIKIAHNSPSRTKPSELETSIAQAVYDLETQVADLKAPLRPLQFHSAREVEVGGGKKAIVIFIPVPLLQQFHKVQQRLTRELEKKFSDRHVVFLALRRILPIPSRRSRVTQKRPRSRTLTAVHENLLQDLVYPTEIVGKRVRTKVDGHKITKVYLDSKEKSVVDYKVDTFGEVYRKLTGKHVTFEFGGATGAEF